MHAMPEILTWKRRCGLVDTIYRDFVDFSSDALAQFLWELVRRSRNQFTALRGKLNSLSDEGFIRFLLAPEVAYRLSWPAALLQHQRADFFLRAVDAERARQGYPWSFTEATWTALGDMCFYPDGQVFQAPRVAGLMPLDFGSPYALGVELGGPGNRPDEVREPFEQQEIARILALLQRARDGIAAVAPSILEFVARFNIVFICQKDPADPIHFRSGATDPYVGRSFVTNPQGMEVDEVDFAEALVHEGIRGLLSIQERRKRWLAGEDRLESGPRIRSPWTGNALAVRSYIQECFVCYGLLHFWRAAVKTGVFAPHRVRDRLLAALGGFYRGPLLSRLRPYRNDMSPDLLEVIPALQENVLAVLNVDENSGPGLHDKRS